MYCPPQSEDFDLILKIPFFKVYCFFVLIKGLFLLYVLIIYLFPQSNLMMGGGAGGLYMMTGGPGVSNPNSAHLQGVLMSGGRMMPAIPGLGTTPYDTDTGEYYL